MLSLKDLHDDIMEAKEIGAWPMAEFVAMRVGLERIERETDSELFERTVRWYVRGFDGYSSIVVGGQTVTVKVSGRTLTEGEEVAALRERVAVLEAERARLIEGHPDCGVCLCPCCVVSEEFAATQERTEPDGT